MANNIVSEAILFWAPYVEMQQWHEAEQLAVKLDRLVEAARVVRDSDHCECKGCVEIFNALDDALTDLELPEKAKE